MRLKEIRPKICVEYITLKQSHVIKRREKIVGFRVGDLVEFFFFV